VCGFHTVQSCVASGDQWYFLVDIGLYRQEKGEIKSGFKLQLGLMVDRID
jgi:hypothetical protein